jgi:hypothetical protein
MVVVLLLASSSCAKVTHHPAAVLRFRTGSNPATLIAFFFECHSLMACTMGVLSCLKVCLVR